MWHPPLPSTRPGNQPDWPIWQLFPLNVKGFFFTDASCYASLHPQTEASRLLDNVHVNLSRSVCSGDQTDFTMSPILEQIQWQIMKWDERSLAAPSWHRPHTACTPRRCSSSPESFLCSPCSILESGSASPHKPAGSWNAWRTHI